ncbi:hypothetical protein AA313_de0200769 [Arthrobotrys entomopaga]|nr:hypothetical protein AA313_de0200769 [Arthrobotrys entomopaga]
MLADTFISTCLTDYIALYHIDRLILLARNKLTLDRIHEPCSKDSLTPTGRNAFIFRTYCQYQQLVCYQVPRLQTHQLNPLAKSNTKLILPSNCSVLILTFEKVLSFPHSSSFESLDLSFRFCFQEYLCDFANDRVEGSRGVSCADGCSEDCKDD